MDATSKSTQRYKRYLLGVLLVIMAFNFVDRMVFGLVLQNIKADLHLSDTQLGFLGGIAFALFYSVLGVPIARWADCGNRITIMTSATVLWSIMVALCGAAGSYAQLLLIRVGVAVGEAGCIPPAHSLIAEYFTRSERPRAAAIYALGGPLSYLIGYLSGGWLNELYGWRITFFLIGVPGVLLALIVRFSLREPRLGKIVPITMPKTPVDTAEKGSNPSTRHVVTVLWANATFRHLLLAFSVIFFFNYGTMQWLPTFFIRSYGVPTSRLGTYLALIFGLGGLLGTYIGGELASRFMPHREGTQLRAMAAALYASGIISSTVYVCFNSSFAFTLLVFFAVLFNTISGPLLGMIQTLVPERMRATAIAFIYLFANLIGMGFGPLAVGAISDLIKPIAGNESLRIALFALSPGYILAGWHLWRATRTIAADLETTKIADGRTSFAMSDASRSGGFHGIA